MFKNLQNDKIMTFFINLLFTLSICYIIGRTYSRNKFSNGALFTLLFCFGFFWIIICGGQYYVGTDYPTYLELFHGDNIEYYRFKNEYLFYYIVIIFNYIGVYGQSLFYIFYLINFIFLFLILKRLDLKFIFIFLLLYICYSNIFNNQLNMLRQATAIHICTYAGVLYSEGKYKYTSLWIIISSLIHISSLCMFSLFLFRNIIKIKTIHLKIVLIISTVGMFFASSNMFSNFSNFLPLYYQTYLEREPTDSSFMTLITKLIFIPLFWISCNINYNYSYNKKILYNIGFLGYCLKLLLLKVPVINRLSDYYIILSIFPIYFLLEYLFKCGKKFLFFTICICLIAIYGLKTILLPQAEYLYNSIYF